MWRGRKAHTAQPHSDNRQTQILLGSEFNNSKLSPVLLAKNEIWKQVVEAYIEVTGKRASRHKLSGLPVSHEDYLAGQIFRTWWSRRVESRSMIWLIQSKFCILKIKVDCLLISSLFISILFLNPLYHVLVVSLLLVEILFLFLEACLSNFHLETASTIPKFLLP